MKKALLALPLLLLAIALVLFQSTSSHASTSQAINLAGNSPYAMYSDSNGDIFITDTVDNTVTELFPNQTTAPYGTTGGGPVAITMDTKGNLYTANSTSNTVTKIGSGGVSSTLGSTGSNPHSLVIDGKGNVYTANEGDSTITKITSSGGTSTFATVSGIPVGMLIDGAGNLYVLNQGTNNITEIASNGATSDYADLSGAPIAMAKDGSNNIYVLLSDSSVTEVVPNGSTGTVYSAFYGTNGLSASAITTDNAGNVYILNQNGGNITEIATSGVSTTYGSVGSNPGSIVADPSGNIYVSNPTARRVTLVTPLQIPKITLPSGITTAYVGRPFPTYTVSYYLDPASLYSISPALTDPGLSFNVSTGQITGVPTQVADVSYYQITGFNAAGSAPTTYIFQVKNVPLIPNISLSSTSETTIADVPISGYQINSTGGPVDSYSISPAITDPGLNFDSTTGLISGTPVAASPTTTYTITGTNYTGSASATFALTINLPPLPVISLSSSSETAYTGFPITGTRPISTGGPIASYSISPTPTDPGLHLTNSGALQGTPSSTSPATVYTITATNASGSTSATFSLTVVNPPPPVISLSTYSETVQVAHDVVAYTVIQSGGPVNYYTISPGFSDPAVSFNTDTGVIFGTTHYALPATNFTITAHNATGTSSAIFRLTVVMPPSPVIHLTSHSENALVGHPLTGYAITSTGGPVDSYSISPALSDPNLHFNTTTGLITGTPSAINFGTAYTVTATNAAGSSSDAYTLNVNMPALPVIALSSGPQSVFVGHSITTVQPVSSGGPIESYSVAPAISDPGLSFNSVTGAISGTPSVARSATNYVITAHNGAGTSSATFNLTVILPQLPAIRLSSNSETAIVGRQITGFTPVSSGGPIDYYTITPQITDAHLTFNTTTGVLSGTPSVSATRTIYLIAAVNGAGSSTATFTLTVNNPPSPVISAALTTETGLVGSPISGPQITVVSGPIDYFTITPQVSDPGLSFNTSTGNISGTPTVTSAATTYTITGHNISGVANVTYALRVTLPAPPNLSLVSAVSQIGYVGIPLTAGHVVNSGGPVASYSISPNVAIPGLSFDSMNQHEVLGTPTTTSSATVYTISATNAAGTSMISFTLSVLTPPPPVITANQNSFTAYVNEPAHISAITLSGGPIASCTISPALTDPGLTFNATDCSILGTPTLVTSATVYTITARNVSGQSSVQITIVGPRAPLPIINLTTHSEVGHVGVPLVGTSPVSSGGPVDSYSISPALTDPGLHFSTASGSLNGTPTSLANTTQYVITATNSSGSTSDIYTLSVRNVIASVAPIATLAQSSDIAYVGTPYVGCFISSSAGVITHYSISPNPVNGLMFNSGQGTIFGTPTKAYGVITYQITASNDVGSSTVTFTLNIVNPSSSVQPTPTPSPGYLPTPTPTPTPLPTPTTTPALAVAPTPSVTPVPQASQNVNVADTPSPTASPTPISTRERPKTAPLVAKSASPSTPSPSPTPSEGQKIGVSPAPSAISEPKGLKIAPKTQNKGIFSAFKIWKKPLRNPIRDLFLLFTGHLYI